MREVERHPHHLTLGGTDENGSDRSRLAIVLRADSHLEQVDLAVREPNADAVAAELEVVERQSRRRQRMGNVVDFVAAVPDANEVGKVVLDDTQVVAGILDVCRQEQRISTANNALLAL